MKLLVDMNLSPAWVPALKSQGWEASHWVDCGLSTDPDHKIFAHARDGGWVIFTNDLDFGTLLAHSRSGAPSVIQLRAQELTPEKLLDLVSRTLTRFQNELSAGALVTIDEQRQRVRLLPLG